MIFRNYLSIIILLLAFSVNAQTKKKSEDNPRVEIFTPEEKDNLQRWFHEEVDKMALTEEQMDEYAHVITYYVYKISRLDDRDQYYTEAYFIRDLNVLLDNQNRDLQGFLTKEQLEKHNEIYGVFLNSAYKRWGIENDRK